IFSEGNEAAATATLQLESARQAEHQAADVELAAIRKQETTVGAAAIGFAALIVLLLIPVRRRPASDDVAEPSLSIARAAAPAGLPAPAAAVPTGYGAASTAVVKQAASLATDFGRARDLDDLKRVVARAADALDASGVMVWTGSSDGGDLRPVLAHGYAAEV